MAPGPRLERCCTCRLSRAGEWPGGSGVSAERASEGSAVPKQVARAAGVGASPARAIHPGRALQTERPALAPSGPVRSARATRNRGRRKRVLTLHQKPFSEGIDDVQTRTRRSSRHTSRALPGNQSPHRRGRRHPVREQPGESSAGRSWVRESRGKTRRRARAALAGKAPSTTPREGVSAPRGERIPGRAQGAEDRPRAKGHRAGAARRAAPGGAPRQSVLLPAMYAGTTSPAALHCCLVSPP